MKQIIPQDFAVMQKAQMKERRCAFRGCTNKFRSNAAVRKYCDEHKIQHVRERKG